MNTARLSNTETGMKLSGDLTCFGLSQLKHVGIQRLSHLMHCEVDCGELMRVDSAGMALFLAWYRYAKKQGKTLIFSKVPAVVKRMANLYSLDSILIFQD